MNVVTRFFLGFCLLAALASCAILPGGDVDIIQSPEDGRSYRYVELDNGLRLLLVSDPKTDVAAASLDVNVGSGSDPEDRQGLAHFLEHMLFLGTEKYPDPDGYHRFISENAGSHNAFTSFDHTNYFFSIHPSRLDPALDRFSQFFIAPLLSDAYVEREKNAVDSEYRSRKEDEFRRSLDVLREVVNPRHPIHKFSIGSLETLSSKEAPVKDDLLRFYNTYYSATNMTLTILGKESLPELERMAKRYFSPIRTFSVADGVISEPLFEVGELPKRVFLKPYKESRELAILFPMPDQNAHFRSKPLALIGHVLGHEGKGSLLSSLKNRQWALELYAGEMLPYNGGTAFSVVVRLTPQGLEHQEEVTAAIFQAIARMRAEGLPQRIFDEVAKVEGLEFRFREPQSPEGLVVELSSALHEYPPEYVLYGNFVLDQYREPLLQETLSHLVPANSLIAVTGADFVADRESRYFRVPYRVERLPEPFLQQIAAITPSDEILLPEVNRLLPESLEYRGSGAGKGLPEKIVDTAEMSWWHKSAGSFPVPKSTIQVSFQKGGVNDSARSAVLLDLYVALVDDALQELAYPARMAGLDFSLYNHAQGVGVMISGFSEKQQELLGMILRHIQDVRLEEKPFLRIREERLRQWMNVEKLPPYKQLPSVFQERIYCHAWSREEKMAALREVSLEELQQFADAFWKDIYVMGLTNGNLTKEESLRIAERSKQLFSAAAEDRAHVQVARLGSGRLFSPVTTKEGDSGYFLYWQGPDDSISTRARLELLGRALEPRFFHELRTEQQLGYVVSAGFYPVLGVPGLSFLVQSPVASPSEIGAAAGAFLKKSLAELQAMPEEEFLTLRQAVIQLVEERPKSLLEESQEYWYLLAQGRTDFRLRERQLEELQQFTLPQWRDFLMAMERDLTSRTFLLVTGSGEGESGLPVLDNLCRNPAGGRYEFP